MEEILASIRKIIEDTDQGHQPLAVASEKPMAAAAEPVSAPSAVDAERAQGRIEPDLDAFREAIAGAASHDEDDEIETLTEIAGSTDDDRPFTLADVQRRLEATQPRQPEQTATSSVQVEEPAPLIDENDEEAMWIAEEEAAPLAASATQVSEVPEATVSSAPRAFASLQDSRNNRPAIISDATGRQVAGAFDELKDAFMASRQKSFDEMAEEMMRPMLQDWLDNNLPVLVERLVREEIERIARG